ncbi:MAG: putative protease [Xanthobacteraceae bacterium]|nr:MAG: putative protease [Xanthobacteraceae bacterium]
MLVLALDTALAACSAAVLDSASGAVLALACEPMERGHAERLIPLVSETCAAAGIAPGACHRFVATTGPGSFTGLRVAISAARAMALATGGDAVGISTLAALSEPWLGSTEPLAVLAAIDARHGHVYASLTAHDRSVIAAPAYLDAAEAARLPSGQPVVLVGPGANAVLAAWPSGASAPVILDERPSPDIALIARLGGEADPALFPCRPLYLKAVDAKPQGSRA